jgi:tetratricopeptide (TPR) repeat protein
VNFDWADWGPPLLVVGVAVVGAAAVVLSSRSGADHARMAEAARREDLSRQRDAAIQALKELELESGKLSAEDHARQRAALIAEGAAAMRALDGLAAGSPTLAPTSALDPELLGLIAKERARLGDAFPDALVAAVPGLRPAGGLVGPEWRGALSALAVVGVLAALANFAGGDAVARRDGGSMTGNQAVGAGEAAPTPSPELASLMAQVEKDPNDVGAWNRLTTIALSERNLAAALERNQKALAAAPNDAEARTYRAVLTAMIGRADAALEQLDAVLAENPNLTTALVYHGLIAAEAGQTEKGIASLERAIAAGAPNPEYLRQQIDSLRSAPPAAPGGPAAPTAPAAAGAPSVAGTITLAPGATAEGARALFLSVRDPAGGPPVLAKRLAPGPFPMAFTLTEADRTPMSGGRPLAASFDLNVRLDLDGDALSRDDGAPGAKLAGMTSGNTNLEVVLR